MVARDCRVTSDLQCEEEGFGRSLAALRASAAANSGPVIAALCVETNAERGLAQSQSAGMRLA